MNGSALQEIPIGTLRKIPAVLPSLTEQRAIAAALSDVDDLIASLDKLIAKKRDIKQAAMQQFLTGTQRLPGFSRKTGYKLTEVGTIPEDWDIASGIEMTTLIGKGASPRWQGFTYTSSGMLFVTSENVREGFLDLTEPKYLPLSFHDKLKRTKLRKGDILINLVGGSIGRTCQVTSDLGEANVNQAVAVFRVSERHWAPFVSYYFQSSTTVARILEMQVDAARPNISLGDLRRFPVAFPPLLEQRAIATVLSDMDAEITALEARRDKTKLLKQGMMQELLSGRIRLV
ncbi:MAG: restriction endonuclease subunit S [Desulfomonilaceae bacterium]